MTGVKVEDTLYESGRSFSRPSNNCAQLIIIIVTIFEIWFTVFVKVLCSILL